MTKFERLKAAMQKAVDMRAAQRDFFKTKDRDALARSKTLEREFDKLAVEALRDDDLLEQGVPPLYPAPSPQYEITITANDFLVSQLPDARTNVGPLCEYIVADALASVAGAIVVGGGGMRAHVKSDGKDWRIVKFLE